MCAVAEPASPSSRLIKKGDGFPIADSIAWSKTGLHPPFVRESFLMRKVVAQAAGLILLGLIISLVACQSGGTSSKSAQMTDPNAVFSQGVFMSFDLHDVSEEDYTKFYNALAKIGLTHWVKGNIGKLELPHSAVIGDFTGISVEDVRDRIRISVLQILEATRLKGFIFVAVGENGTWGSQSLS